MAKEIAGSSEGGYEQGVEGTQCRECRASWEGVSGAVSATTAKPNVRGIDVRFGVRTGMRS